MRHSFAIAIFAAAALTAAGCGNEENDFVVGQVPVGPSPILITSPIPIVSPLPEAAFVGLDNTGTVLLRFSSSTTAAPVRVPITNLPAGFILVGIDYRPQTNGLYGLGYSANTTTVQLFALNADNGRADAVGTTGVPGTQIIGVNFGFDFNPAADRIRVTTDTGLNFRMNPNDGSIVDGDNGNSVAAPGVQLDGSISGQTTYIDGAAYTNNQANNGNVTTLYTIDATTNRLFIQSPPNSGTQTAGLNITVGGTPLLFQSVNGFDIPAGVNTAANNAPVAAGSGFAALVANAGARLYAVNLVTGQATPGGLIGDGAPLRGLTVQPPDGARPLVGLDATGSNLVRFSTAGPGTPTSAAITGVTAGETLVGIDYRPATGQLYGLGINPTADNGSVYRLDPQTGAASVIGTAGAIRYVNTAGNVIDLPPASAGYGIDFNPTVDRLRVTTGTGLNARVNQLDGTPVDGDTTAPGVQPDGAINGLPAGSTGVSGAAYSNNFSGATNTTLYTIDATSATLFIQNPANAGTQTVGVPLRLNGNAIQFTAVNGFEIARPSGPQILIFPSSDPGYVALTTGASTSVYALNVASGALNLLGTAPGQLSGLTGGN